MTLRISSPEQEGVYQGSKFLKFQVLCDRNELETLFNAIVPCYLFPMTTISDGSSLSIEAFLKAYGEWIELLKKGAVPNDAELRKFLAAALTKETDALWKQEISGKRFLIKMAKPLIQVQAHFFTFSRIDGVFRPMTMGQGSIFWGLQFSFPQIYQDPKTMELCEVGDSPNKELFGKIKRWVRDVTRPTPFVVDGQKTNVPIRLGKACFSWIANHPQLQAQGIEVYES